jgi:hypothetical protein
MRSALGHGERAPMSEVSALAGGQGKGGFQGCAGQIVYVQPIQAVRDVMQGVCHSKIRHIIFPLKVKQCITILIIVLKTAQSFSAKYLQRKKVEPQIWPDCEEEP